MSNQRLEKFRRYRKFWKKAKRKEWAQDVYVVDFKNKKLIEKNPEPDTLAQRFKKLWRIV